MTLPDALAKILDWERTLLGAGSFAAWLQAAAGPPDARTDDAVSLILADPTDELRHLTAGADRVQHAVLPVSYVDSLAGRAPQFDALHGPWAGAYRVVDHGLLFPAALGLTHLLMLPLLRGGQLAGVYSLGGRSGPPALSSADAGLLEHAATVIATSLERSFDRARLLRGGHADPLTGWNSARYLQVRLREEIARCQRHGGSVACLVADVDRLQQVNDEHGQPAGDLALTEIADRIESQVRACDAAGRVGSDVFGVVLPATDAARAVPLAERVLAAVSRAPVDLGGGQQRTLSVSIGIAALAPAPAADRKALSEEVIANAIAAMHRAKQRGGGGYEIAP